eukprot:TRINITY_DN2824_c0_g3_i1.p1 TRINITY_DN2824_c0_g3~~TRINITY_DN2824_c0_g3_i1.p1  ORF type:complete len:163 (-),score=11.01 TRINITY_DN2824_c0_g3_i1:217-705(-)
MLPNKGPVLTVPKTVPVIKGQTTTFQANGADPDGDAITYQLDNYSIPPPNGVSFTKSVLLTIDGLLLNEGKYLLSCTVSDGNSTGTVVFNTWVYSVPSVCSADCTHLMYSALLSLLADRAQQKRQHTQLGVERRSQVHHSLIRSHNFSTLITIKYSISPPTK